MKRIIIGAALLVVLSTAQAQKIKLGEALVFHAPDLKPDADAKVFEARVLNELAPAWKLNAPGMELHLVRKDRGNLKGQYLLAYTTDTLSRHKNYASATAEGYPFTADLLAKGNAGTGLTHFVSSDGKYVEYHLVGKVAELPEVEVLGIHYIKVRPDRRETSTVSSLKNFTRRWGTFGPI